MSLISMTFDLSSTCIGVTFAQTDDNNRIIYGKTLPIVPVRPTGIDLGYSTKKQKKITARGNTYAAFLKPDEILISQVEAKKRSREFKTLEHNYLLRNIGEQCGKYLDKIKPDIVAIERNKSFNGILTTKLLAEIAGGLYFYCGAKGITLFDWDEATVRSKIRKDINTFRRTIDGSEGNEVALDTKWEIFCRLREYFTKNHPGTFDFSNMTLDESDSLAVFYYLFTKVIKGD
jgi:hypothetical protein